MIRPNTTTYERDDATVAGPAPEACQTSQYDFLIRTLDPDPGFPLWPEYCLLRGPAGLVKGMDCPSDSEEGRAWLALWNNRALWLLFAGLSWWEEG
jgi:hypothetical protein